MNTAADPIYLTDMDRCCPSSALSPEPRRGHWRTLDYETDTLSGVMLAAGPETVAPEVSYSPGVSGWHAIHVGMFGDYNYAVQTLLKTSADQTFTMMEAPQLEPPRKGSIVVTPANRQRQVQELFWKVTDLTGQEIVLGQPTRQVAEGDGPGSRHCETSRIAYIKLIPLSDAEVGKLRADRERNDTRRLYAHNDAHGPHQLHRPTTAEEIRREIEPYRNTDFARIYWEAGGGDGLNYFTRIGRTSAFDGLDDFDQPLYRLQAESWRILRDRGIDPFQIALDHAHEIGLEFHAGYRVAGFHYPPPYDHFNYGDSFYARHPELRGVDRNGNVTPRVSYAFPETRRYVISVLREVAGFEIDGIALLYNRRPPLLDYEPPLVESFRSEYDLDPRRLDEDDPRWLSYRARTLTLFMREVRQAMDAVAEEQERDRRIEVSAVVMSNEEENLYNAMDLKAWVEEGLVDTLIPYSSGPNLDSLSDSWTDVRDLDYWLSLTKGTSCRLAPNVMPRDLSPEEYRRRASALYAAGVENLFFWDSATRRANFSASWNALRRLGHKEEIASWTEAGEPSLANPTHVLRRLGDWDMRYVTPG